MILMLVSFKIYFYECFFILNKYSVVCLLLCSVAKVEYGKLHEFHVPQNLDLLLTDHLQ